MKKILICGLPGSGKTTLASEIKKLAPDFEWFNADQVRQEHNDWDFSPEGRLRQCLRMKRLCEQTSGYAVADFVCPTQELRTAFEPDFVVWMDTIESGRYSDTNRVFQAVENADLIIDQHTWWNEQYTQSWARKIVLTVKQHEFDWTKPTVQMLGRYQPWHAGHRALFERALAKTGQVAIMIRTMPVSDSNPFSMMQVQDRIQQDLIEYAGKFVTLPVPNIVNITYGRDVGYEIEQEDLGKDIHQISATEIRKNMNIGDIT